jgi:VRR-NUC domain
MHVSPGLACVRRGGNVAVTARRLLERDPSLLTEAELSSLVAELARLGGWRLRYHTLRSKGSASGFPDWVFVHPAKGRVLFVELKSEKGRLSDRQNEWIVGLMGIASVEVCVWRPSDWDEIVETLTGRRPA